MPIAYCIEYGIWNSVEKRGPDTLWKHSIDVGNEQLKARDSTSLRTLPIIASIFLSWMNPLVELGVEPNWPFPPGSKLLVIAFPVRNSSAPGGPRSARSNNRRLSIA